MSDYMYIEDFKWEYKQINFYYVHQEYKMSPNCWTSHAALIAYSKECYRHIDLWKLNVTDYVWLVVVLKCTKLSFYRF
jgi:hypothetical protein